MYTLLITNIKSNKYFVGITLSTDNESEFKEMITKFTETFKNHNYETKIEYDTYSPTNITITNNVCRIYVSPFKGEQTIW